MITKEHRGTKECCFYSGEYHLEMMLLPYIAKKIDKTNFIILTENNLEDSVKKILNNINLEDREKEKIYQLGWKNNNLEKLIKIKKDIGNNKNITIFINGNENFNKIIKNDIKLYNNEINIIDCYDTNQVNQDEIYEKIKIYDGILNTKRLC